VLGPTPDLRGESFDRLREDRAVGRAPACSSGSVASVRSVRWLQAHRSSSRVETARPRRAAPHRYGMRRRARLGGSRTEIVTGFRLAGWPILDRPDRLGGITIDAVLSHGIAHTAGEHAVRLGAEELRPAGADPPRRRPEARSAQHGRDRGGRDADPELEQFALDAHVAPARVLPRQPRDQAARLGRKRRTTRRTAAATSASREQRPVPAAKRLRANRKAGPALGWEQTAGRCKQGAIDGRVLRPLSAAPEDRQLVTQDDDLKFSLTTAADERANKPAQDPIQQTRQHKAQSEPLRPPSPATTVPANRVSLPHRAYPRIPARRVVGRRAVPSRG
jgi:hypothetical protein